MYWLLYNQGSRDSIDKPMTAMDTLEEGGEINFSALAQTLGEFNYIILLSSRSPIVRYLGVD